MKNKKFTLLSTLLAGSLACVLLPSMAAAQSMSPMRGKVQSFTDSFALQVLPANPYGHSIRVEVKVYDANFFPIPEARVMPENFTLGANAARKVVVSVPFESGKKDRRVRVCTESVPFPGRSGQSIKAQICGKFIGERR